MNTCFGENMFLVNMWFWVKTVFRKNKSFLKNFLCEHFSFHIYFGWSVAFSENFCLIKKSLMIRHLLLEKTKKLWEHNVWSKNVFSENMFLAKNIFFGDNMFLVKTCVWWHTILRHHVLWERKKNCVKRDFFMKICFLGENIFLCKVFLLKKIYILSKTFIWVWLLHAI